MTDCWEDDFNPSTLTKDPIGVLDYPIDWQPAADKIPTGTGPWLETSETIESSEWTVTGPDDALTTSQADHDNTTTIVWLTGGTLGAEYQLRNVITTDQGRIESKTRTIRIQTH